MSRNLPVLVVQEASRPHGIDSELLDFEAELAVHLSDFGADFEQPRWWFIRSFIYAVPPVRLSSAGSNWKLLLNRSMAPVTSTYHVSPATWEYGCCPAQYASGERTGICTTPRRCIRPKVSEWPPTVSVSPGGLTSLSAGRSL